MALTGSSRLDAARAYLQLCEERHLDEASAYLAPNAELIFPGNRRFRALHDMVESSRGRYRTVSKNIEFSAVGARQDDQRPCVIITGTLHGVRMDGEKFTGVRFRDLFVFDGELISEQHVFNDLAELGVVIGR